jgi:FixJ family two-component response regulator
MNSDGIHELSKILGSKEIEVIKLIAVGFKSKEIALLLDVTPQYINNIRHQIRNTLGENTLELDEVINRIKGDLSFS